MAEREGFEPSERGHRSTVFKTAAFNHSATSPNNGFQDRRIQPLCHLSKAVISYRIIQFFASRGFSKLGFAS